MTRHVYSACLVVALFALSAMGQAPTLNAGGVVNDASYAVVGAPNYGLTPGGLGAAFGSNLAAALTIAPGVLPFPKTLGGTSVTVGGIPAPLYFVSASQIAFFVPWATPLGSQLVVVTTAGGTSNAVSVNIVPAAPGLFSLGQNGQGPAASLVARLSDPNHPFVQSFSAAAKPGDFAVLYLTNLDTTAGAPPADGDFDVPAGTFPAPAHPVQVLVAGQLITPAFTGLVGPGLWQLNFQLPDDLPDDCFVPVQVIDNAVVSNAVTLAVSASGDCTNTPTAALAPAPGVKFLVANLDNIIVPNSVLGDETFNRFTATALQAPVAGQSVATVQFPAVGTCVSYVTAGSSSTPSVANPFNGAALDAGALTFTPPGQTAIAVTPTSTGVWTYPANPLLGSFTWASGNWTLSGSGGADIGTFGPVTLNVADTLQVGSYGDTSGVITRASGMTATWTCPLTNQPNARVFVLVNSANTDTDITGTLWCSASCSANQITVPPVYLNQLPASTAQGAAIGLLLFPDPGTAARFTAPGLDFGVFAWQQLFLKGTLTAQ